MRSEDGRRCIGRHNSNLLEEAYAVEGSDRLTKAQALAHGVAPNDNCASGLALSLRDRQLATYKVFRHGVASGSLRWVF